MGIVNATPDSFSDGGRLATPDQAVEHALQLVAEGAGILDIGGESTRPYSDPVGRQEELDRVLPVVERLARATRVPLSIDTSKAAVARAAIEAGAEIINDVTGLEGDPEMVDVALETGAGLCAMHMQGTPQTMQDDPSYTDVVSEILAYLVARRDALLERGIEAERICLDPGIGFGKTHAHNLQLVRQVATFQQTGCPILVGHSRKGFLGKILGDKTTDRDLATATMAVSLAEQQVQVIRVHNVKACRQALDVWRAIGATIED
ncbi:MAG: dihydropteroate synthase [Phycisphaerales bacterium]|nr:dihydropteroate synthase [Phycisphaerales bacterium]